jgi:tRNA U38,U39,U40 pseudouridine synthase TruA
MFSQEIDKVTYEKLVDYVNCRYTAAYIERFRNNPTEQPNIRKFDSNIKDKLNQCKLEAPILFGELSQLLKDNGWSKTEKEFSSKINDKKKQYEANSNCEQLISGLIIDGKVAKGLENIINDLQNELKEKYCKQIEYITSEPVQQQTQTYQNEKSSDTWLMIAIIAIGVILLLVVVFLIFFLREYIKRVAESSQRLEMKFASSNHLHEQINHTPNEREISDIKRRLQDINNKLLPQQQSIKERESQAHQPNPPIKPPVTKYPRAIISNGFRDDLSDIQGDSYFEFFEIQGDNARYNFCGNNIDRAKANKIEIEEVCEISGSAFNAHEIRNIENGSAVLRNGKWEVTKKAKIKFV